jgi:hypothetical protein
MAVSDRPLVMRTQEEDVVLILVFSNIQSTTGNLYYKSSGVRGTLSFNCGVTIDRPAEDLCHITLHPIPGL